MLSPASVVVQTDAVQTATVGAELVMMSIESNGYFGLDAIGRRIWELIAEPRSIGDICALLTAEFDVAPVRCEADVLHFLNELVGYGVVRAEAANRAVA